jgi:hypothetical protein
VAFGACAARRGGSLRRRLFFETARARAAGSFNWHPRCRRSRSPSSKPKRAICHTRRRPNASSLCALARTQGGTASANKPAARDGKLTSISSGIVTADRRVWPP